MKKRFVYWLVIVVLVFVLAYFIFSSNIFSNINNRASLSEANETDLLSDVKAYVTSNIDKYNDGINIFTKNELLANNVIKKDNELKDNDRVFVEISNNEVTSAYIKNRSINNYMMNEVDKDFVTIGSSYYYVGNDVNNYILFNSELYRILKVNNDGNLFIIKNDKENVVSTDKIDMHIQIFKNRKYYSYIKDVSLLNISDYNNTIKDGKTFLESNYMYFVNTSNGYTVINGITGKESEAALKLVIEIDKEASYEKGNGSMLDPIIISE